MTLAKTRTERNPSAEIHGARRPAEIKIRLYRDVPAAGEAAGFLRPNCRCPWLRETIAQGGEMIKKVKGGYKVVSEKTGKNLGGPYKSKAAAKKRLQQVEFFKRTKG